MGNALNLRLRRSLAIVLTALISCICVGNARAATPTHTLLILGDSITWGANYKGFGNVTPKLQALNTFDKVIVDASFSRNISGPANTLHNGVKTYAKHLKAKVRPSAVIVALGSNDLQGSIKVRYYETRIRELLTLIGDVPVVWVNVLRIDSKYYIRASAVFNTVLSRVAIDYPNVSVVLDEGLRLLADGAHGPPVEKRQEIRLRRAGHAAGSAVLLRPLRRRAGRAHPQGAARCRGQGQGA